MKKPIKTIDEKEAIITEYLTGRTTFRKLGAKYGIDFRMINSWVMEYQGRNLKSSQPSAPEPAKEPSLTTDVNELHKEVRRLQLHNKLLNAIIDIAEDELNIDIRKKSGTKQ